LIFAYIQGEEASTAALRAAGVGQYLEHQQVCAWGVYTRVGLRECAGNCHFGKLGASI
jgi:hypothetical protein